MLINRTESLGPEWSNTLLDMELMYDTIQSMGLMKSDRQHFVTLVSHILQVVTPETDDEFIELIKTCRKGMEYYSNEGEPWDDDEIDRCDRCRQEKELGPSLCQEPPLPGQSIHDSRFYSLCVDCLTEISPYPADYVDDAVYINDMPDHTEGTFYFIWYDSHYRHYVYLYYWYEFLTKATDDISQIEAISQSSLLNEEDRIYDIGCGGYESLHLLLEAPVTVAIAKEA